jgi:hypothetical protein
VHSAGAGDTLQSTVGHACEHAELAEPQRWQSRAVAPGKQAPPPVGDTASSAMSGTVSNRTSDRPTSAVLKGSSKLASGISDDEITKVSMPISTSAASLFCGGAPPPSQPIKISPTIIQVRIPDVIMR